MNTRGVGLLLILTLVIALGALIQDYRLAGLVAHERAAAGSTTYELRELDGAVAQIQDAQRGYVAPGQTPSDWYGRATKLTDEATQILNRRRSAAQDPDVAAAYTAATEAFARVRRTDAQIRASNEQGDKLRASDLIFLDSASGFQQVRDAVAIARTRELAATDTAIAKVERLRAGMTGIAMLFVLGVAIYLGRSATRSAVRGAPTMAQMLRDLPPAVKTGTAAATAAAAAVPTVSALPPVTRPANLAAAAELCVDLARVLDSGEVPVLLDRAASVLDARGIVLWAVDADGARLHPSICHGYSDRVVQKLRPLQIDADNVTSLAFRSNQPQTINGATAADAAAIAIPLLTGTGCVGVLAAELRHNRPPADLMPVARILGAQFSTLIALPEPSARRTAQA